MGYGLLCFPSYNWFSLLIVLAYLEHSPIIIKFPSANAAMRLEHALQPASGQCQKSPPDKGHEPVFLCLGISLFCLTGSIQTGVSDFAGIGVSGPGKTNQGWEGGYIGSATASAPFPASVKPPPPPWTLPCAVLPTYSLLAYWEEGSGPWQ